MITIPAYIKKLEVIKKKINSTTSRQVQSSKLRGEIRALTEDYFKTIRPSIINNTEKNSDISHADGEMQELLVSCHKAGVKSGYLAKIGTIRSWLISLDSKALVFSTSPASSESSIDSQIIDTL